MLIDSAAEPFSELVWGEQLWAFLTDQYFQSLPHMQGIGDSVACMGCSAPGGCGVGSRGEGQERPCRLPGWLQPGGARRSGHPGVFTQE